MQKTLSFQELGDLLSRFVAEDAHAPETEIDLLPLAGEKPMPAGRQ